MPAVQLNDGVNVADSSSLPNVSPDAGANNDDSVAFQQHELESREETVNEDASRENETTDEFMDVLGNGQLKLKTIKNGTPDSRPQANDVCEIKLKGTLSDGTVVEQFDSLKIQLGSHEVIQGVELAVPLMNIGEEAIVVVAARFGYGSIGNPPSIPPDATITYEITLINSSPEPSLEVIPFDKRKTLANNKKERGNWWYSRQEFTMAIQCYRKALDILDETVAFHNEEGNYTDYSEDQVMYNIEQKLLIYNNLAAALITIEAYDSALMSVNRVLQCDPKNLKALFRKGKILAAKGETNEAVKCLREAFLLEPGNIAIKMELSRCVKLQQAEKQHEMNLYKKMLGSEKKDEKPNVNSKIKSSSWSKMVGTAATATIMAVVAFAVCYRFKNYSFL